MSVTETLKVRTALSVVHSWFVSSREQLNSVGRDGGAIFDDFGVAPSGLGYGKGIPMRIVFLIFAVFLMASCEEAGERLSAKEVREMLFGGQAVAFKSGRLAGTATFQSNGSAVLNVPAVGEDMGRWWQDDDQVCSQWERAFRGRVTCAFVDRLSDEEYALVDASSGVRMGTFRLID